MTEIHTAVTVTDTILDRVAWIALAWLFLSKVSLLIAAHCIPGGHPIAARYMKWEARWFVLASPVAVYELSFGMALYAVATSIMVWICERELTELRNRDDVAFAASAMDQILQYVQTRDKRPHDTERS